MTRRHTWAPPKPVLHGILQGNYPAVLGYYSDDLKALARGMISTNPNVRPNADEVQKKSLLIRSRIGSVVD